jgi:facilitated trehalose transporter
MFDAIHVEGTFLLYGSSVLLGSIVLYFCMTESKNKTLQEIEEEFKKQKCCT